MVEKDEIVYVRQAETRAFASLWRETGAFIHVGEERRDILSQVGGRQGSFRQLNKRDRFIFQVEEKDETFYVRYAGDKIAYDN